MKSIKIGGKESGIFFNEQKNLNIDKIKETKSDIQDLQDLLTKKKENMKKSIASFKKFKETNDICKTLKII